MREWLIGIAVNGNYCWSIRCKTLASKSYPIKSEKLFMCGLLRCQISAGCEELLVRNSWATCPCPESFWRLGIDLAGTWWSAWEKVEYVISCKAWIALRTSILRVATSWCRVDTCVSSLSTDFRITTGFSSLISSCKSSSEMLSGIILLLLLMLMGLLLTLGLRDFEVFSLRAMRVCLLWDNWKGNHAAHSRMIDELTFGWALRDVPGSLPKHHG